MEKQNSEYLYFPLQVWKKKKFFLNILLLMFTGCFLSRGVGCNFSFLSCIEPEKRFLVVKFEIILRIVHFVFREM